MILVDMDIININLMNIDNNMEESKVTTFVSLQSKKSEREFTTIPIPGNLQESMHLMTSEQIALNLIEFK